MNDIGRINATGQPAIAGSFHTLVVQPTSFCNLDCTYCYLPDRRSLRLMSGAVAQACAESIAQQNSGHPVSVVWHGGEPTATPIGLFRDLLAPFEELRRAGMVRHEIQTNATLINRQWCELFTAYGFEVGVSIDGPGALVGVDVAADQAVEVGGGSGGPGQSVLQEGASFKEELRLTQLVNGLL